MQKRHLSPEVPQVQPNARDAASLPGWLQIVKKHLESVRYGSIQITVTDSIVRQVEVSEKLRVPAPGPTRVAGRLHHH